MYGANGPIPKRSDQRRRRNKDAVGVDTAAASVDVGVPEADEDWHPIAKLWYESLTESGQRVFFEPSDWSTAYLIAESISRDLKPQFVGTNEVTGEPIVKAIPLKGASLAAYLKAMSVLMVTEGDRRRLRLELERGEADTSADDAKIAVMDRYRKAAQA